MANTSSTNMDKSYAQWSFIQRRAPIWLLVYVSILHGLMLLYDVAHPARFLNADRANERWDATQTFLSIHANKTELIHYFVSHGIIGDYFFQTLFYRLGGQYTVILAQICLLIMSVVALYRLTAMLTHSAHAGLATALLYVHLPQSLVFPHVLSSEAIFDPLVIMSFYFAIRSCIAKNQRWHKLIMSALLLGLATVVRPITALWPCVFVVLFLLSGIRAKQSVMYFILALLPLICWMTFIWSQTGIFSMGSSSHDLGHNLYHRVKVIISFMPEKKQKEASRDFLSVPSGHERATMSITRYLHFGIEYPRAFFAHLATDGIVYLGKSGIEKLTVDYFRIIDSTKRRILTDPNTGWRQWVESMGLFPAMGRLLTNYPILMFFSILGVILMVGIWFLSAVGTWYEITLFDRRSIVAENLCLLIISLFPLYVFATSQVTTIMQSRHRAPAEFSLCIMSVLGWKALRAKYAKIYADRSHNSAPLQKDI